MSRKSSGDSHIENRRRIRIVILENRICSHHKRFFAYWKVYIVCVVNIGTKDTIFVIIEILVVASNVVRIEYFSEKSTSNAVFVDVVFACSLRKTGLFLGTESFVGLKYTFFYFWISNRHCDCWDIIKMSRIRWNSMDFGAFCCFDAFCRGALVMCGVTVLLGRLVSNHTEKHCPCQRCRCRCHLYRLLYRIN